MKHIYFLSLLLLLFSCAKDKVTATPSDNSTDLILKVTIKGELVPKKVTLDNSSRKITIDFPIGSVPDKVDVELELNEGVRMLRPQSTQNTFDLREVIPIYLEYKSNEYRYLIVANYTEDNDEIYMREGEINDMSLMYYGGSHRSTKWTDEELQAYVSWTDKQGKEHWLFDTFLFLETTVGNGRYFESGFDSVGDGSIGARKEDWQKVMDDYFDENGPIARLDKVISKTAGRIGSPKYKRRLVIFVPAAFYRQQNWGELNGKNMNFTLSQDRIDASAWYIDSVIDKVAALNLKYLSFDGFYFVAEQLTNNRQYLPSVADYIKSKGRKFYWIPYWGSDGMTEWRAMHFDKAFLQPNYFFPEKKPDYQSFFDSVIRTAINSGMSLEMEYDERALKKSTADYRAERFWDYIKAFTDYGIMDNYPIAYYQGDCMVYTLKCSSDTDDQSIYNTLCEKVVTRQQKRGEK